MKNLAVIWWWKMGLYSAEAIFPNLGKWWRLTIVERDTGRHDAIKRQFDWIWETRVLESPWRELNEADLLIFAVPTEHVRESMRAALCHCKKWAIISGQTSVKQPESDSFNGFMLENPHSVLQYIPMHTMCNPTRSDPKKEKLLLVRDLRVSEEVFNHMLEIYKKISDNISILDSVWEHDRVLANTQVVTSWFLLSRASAIASSKLFPWNHDKYNSWIDVILHNMTMRILDQKSHVYKWIWFQSPRAGLIFKNWTIFLNRIRKAIASKEYIRVAEWIKNARRLIYKNKQYDPIMAQEFVNKFELPNASMNSYMPLVFYYIMMLINEINPFEDLVWATPNYNVLLCLVDYLLSNEDRLLKALESHFASWKIAWEDFVFWEFAAKWASIQEFNISKLYDREHHELITKIESEWRKKNKNLIEEGALNSEAIVDEASSCVFRALWNWRILKWAIDVESLREWFRSLL